MFTNEAVNSFMSLNLAIYLYENNINLIYDEYGYITRRFTNISRAVQLEYIAIIIRMSIKRLEYFLKFSINKIIICY